MSKIICFLLLIFCTIASKAQNPENWTSKQLVEPSTLARAIQSGKNVPLIFSVGPGAPIPHSVAIGIVKDQENLDKLKKELSTIPRNKHIVIYCGCCPFEHCPNIRPAIAVLKNMKFTHYQLLNLPHNIKADWIDQGYPVEK
ncbi:MAG: rhodanese-like domain-containing protein [Flavisolibacter sp.]